MPGYCRHGRAGKGSTALGSSQAGKVVPKPAPTSTAFGARLRRPLSNVRIVTWSKVARAAGTDDSSTWSDGAVATVCAGVE